MQEPRIAGLRPVPASELYTFVERHTGQKALRCYQCGKCSAGCPSGSFMDLTPRQVMRAIQLGLKDELLNSSTIWLCVGCQTCSVRCPQQIDIARVMEVLRVLAIAEKSRPAEREVAVFHRIFLGIVERLGRIWEAGLAGLYNLLSGHLVANMRLAPVLIAKGKLSFFPRRARGAGEVRRIMARVRALEASSTGEEK